MSTVGGQMTYDLDGTVDGGVMLPFSFDPNGTSDPTSVKGRVSSVKYLANNKWTVTLQANFKGLLGAGFMIACAAGDPGEGFKIEVDTAGTNLQNGVVVLASVNAAGSRATIASATNQRIHVLLHLTTSLLDPGTTT